MRHASPCGAPGALLPSRGALLFADFCSLFVLTLLQTSNAACRSVPGLVLPPGASRERGRRPTSEAPVLYRRELSQPLIDRDWPHQVALPAYRCHGHNYLTMRLFCEALSLFPRTHSLRRDDEDKIVFSFATHAHAEKFLKRFSGEIIAAKDPPMWAGPRTLRTETTLWTIASATAAASIAPTEEPRHEGVPVSCSSMRDMASYAAGGSVA